MCGLWVSSQAIYHCAQTNHVSLNLSSTCLTILKTLYDLMYITRTRTTPGRRQSKTLSTINEHGSTIDRNSVFDCQIAIKNPVSIDFWSKFLYSIGVFDCHLLGVRTILRFPKIFVQTQGELCFVLEEKWPKDTFYVTKIHPTCICSSISKIFMRKFVLSISLNICFGCSKEPSYWDGSFEDQQNTFWWRNNRMNFKLHTYLLACLIFQGAMPCLYI